MTMNEKWVYLPKPKQNFQYEKNCVVCILAPIISFGTSIGISQIEGHCKHRNKRICETEFRKSNHAYLFPSIMVVVLGGNLIHQVYLLQKPLTHFQLVQHVSEVLYVNSALVILIISEFFKKRKN